MSMGKEYRKNANACMELAKTAKSETEREVLSDFARSWLQAAVNAESSDECKFRTNLCGQGKIGTLIQMLRIGSMERPSRCSMSAIPAEHAAVTTGTIEAKTSDGLSSHEGFSKLASRLFVSGLAPAIIRWPAQRPPNSRRLSPRQVDQREAAGGPRPARDKGRGPFLNSAYPSCEAMIREQLAIATVAFAISFVAITEVLLSLM